MRYKLSRSCNVQEKLLKSIIKSKIIILLFVFAALVLGIFVYNRLVTDAVMNPLKNEAVSMINETVASSADRYLSENKDFSERCITQSSGNVTSYSVDAELVGKAEREIISDIISSLEDMRVISAKIPLGTLSKIKYFSGRGIPVNVRGYLSPSVTSEITSTVESAGINQSLYRVVLNVSVNAEIMLHGKSEKISLTGKATLAEKLIIGKVPLGET
ncbi:MAG: hypothetical protein HFE30_09080 [Clostridiales bacterium]|nr:hypothetical protein [Clostridiales bacterium]